MKFDYDIGALNWIIIACIFKSQEEYTLY